MLGDYDCLLVPSLNFIKTVLLAKSGGPARTCHRIKSQLHQWLARNTGSRDIADPGQTQCIRLVRQ